MLPTSMGTRARWRAQHTFWKNRKRAADNPAYTTSCGLTRNAAGRSANNEWVFPAATRSGHIEKSTSEEATSRRRANWRRSEPFSLYTFRHTCLTRWAAYMDPYTLAYLAGHSDFSTTRRYVHPQAQTVRDAMERARTGAG